MKKILFVVDERKIGGVSILLENIFKSIPSLNADVLVIHNNGGRLEGINNLNLIYGTKLFDTCDESLIYLIKKMKLKKIIRKLYLIFLIKTGFIKKAIIKERKKILNKKYDIEISFKDGFGTFFVAFGNANKKVRWIHNDFYMNNPGNHYEKLYKEAINQFDVIVAISKIIKEHFNELFGKQSETIVIPNIVKLAKLNYKENKQHNFEIVVIGRLSKVKRYDMLINIINELNKENLFENSILKIIGSGEEEQSLKNMVNKFNLNHKVTFLGKKENPWNYASNADLFVMCSKYEACPLTVIESQLSKIPVLSTNFSASFELISDKNGLIVDNNYDGILNGLKSLITDKEKLLKYKKNLKNYKYDNDKIIDMIKDLLEL